MDIHGKVAIITGASSGIGRATARLFSAHGAKVALVARSADTLQQLAQELPNSFAYPLDMRDTGAIPAMIAAVKEHYGQIDILINNAGQGMPVPIEEANLDDFRAVIELNVISALAALQSVVPVMRAQGGGVIVNISSGLSKTIMRGVGPYASTKYMLNALSQTARLELADDNIRVGLMYPGLTATEFFANTLGEYTPHGDNAQPAAQADSPESAAQKILEAVSTEAPEVYADSITARA